MKTTTEKTLLDQGSSTKFIVTFLISFLIAKMFGIVFTKIFTNVLSLNEMGEYTVILSAITLIMSFAALGFPSAINRYAIRYKTKGIIENLKDFIFTGFVSFIIMEVIVILGILIAFFVTGQQFLFPNSDRFVFSLILVAGIVIAQLFSTICFSIATSLQNSRFYAVIILMRVVLQLPFGILFVLVFKWGVFGLVASLAVSEISVAVFSVVVIIRDIGIGKFSKAELKKILEYSLPVYINGFLMYGFDLAILLYITSQTWLNPALPVAKIPGFMLSNAINLTGTEVIALYRYGALTVVNLFLIAGNIFGLVYRPVILKFFERDDYDSMRKMSIQIFKLFLIFMFPIVLILFAFSPYIILLLTLVDYLPSLAVIPLLLLSIFVQYMGNIRNYGHSLYFKNYWNLIVGVVAVLLAVLTAYFIMPFDGLLALGAAYLVRRTIYFLGLAIVSQRYFKVDYPKKITSSLFGVMVFSASIGAILYYLAFTFLNNNLNILISFGIATIVFAIAVLVFKLITREDIQFLLNIARNYFKNMGVTKNNAKAN